MFKYWMVWCVGGGAPTYQHRSYDAAKKEAERLALQHPGKRFDVLEAKSSAVKNAVTWVELTDADEELPF